MRKSSYLKTVHEITKEVREKFGKTYARAYSEPSRPTGYRTKLWDCDNSKKVANLINKKFGDVVTAEAYVAGSRGWEYDNVQIRPVKRVRAH